MDDPVSSFSVFIAMSPMSYRFAFPVSRAPPTIGMGVPLALSPMRRLKNGTRLPPGPKPPPGPKLKYPSFRERIRVFRKEKVEPGEVDLLGVGFHLCEIRMIGQVEGEGLRQSIFRIDSAIVVFDGCERSSSSHRVAFAHIRDTGRHKRLDPEVSSRIDVSMPTRVPASDIF